MATLIACRDCGAIQHMPPAPEAGDVQCYQCARPLEKTAGRSLDGALACSIATFLLLFPANLLPLMTVHILGVSTSTYIASGLSYSWRENWPWVTIVLALAGIVLPFLRFGLLSVTLTAIRFGFHGPWAGTAFRYCETLDLWAMADVLLIGAGIGYGRVVSQLPVQIDAGGWCFVGTALLTMITRASLERRAVWRRLKMPPSKLGPGSVACTYCDLLLPQEFEEERCPRCMGRVHRRFPYSFRQCAALTAACWLVTPLAYAFPMSEYWRAGTAHPRTIIIGIKLLFEHGYWYFGIVIFLLSVWLPFSKLAGLTWFLITVRYEHSRAHLRFKTRFYRFVDESGRWSMLDPFTVMIFAPMVQFGQEIHTEFLGGTAAYIAAIILSMVAARVFDPRLMWDTMETGEELAAIEAVGA